MNIEDLKLRLELARKREEQAKASPPMGRTDLPSAGIACAIEAQNRAEEGPDKPLQCPDSGPEGSSAPENTLKLAETARDGQVVVDPTLALDTSPGVTTSGSTPMSAHPSSATDPTLSTLCEIANKTSSATVSDTVRQCSTPSTLLPPPAPARRRGTILDWLLDLGRAVIRRKLDGAWLGIETLAEIVLNEIGIELPGCREGHDLGDPGEWGSMLKGLGRRMSQCLGGKQSITLQEITVTRRSQVFRSGRETPRIYHHYMFSVTGDVPEKPTTAEVEDASLAVVEGEDKPATTAGSVHPSEGKADISAGTRAAVDHVDGQELQAIATDGKRAAEGLAQSIAASVDNFGLTAEQGCRVRTLATSIATGHHLDVFYLQLGRNLRYGGDVAKGFADRVNAIMCESGWIVKTDWQKCGRRISETVDVGAV